MSDTEKKSGFWLTFAAVIGGFALFVLIVFIAYLPRKPEPLTEGTKTPEERARILTEMRAKEAAGNGYAWIDQQKGIVRLPIDRATELTIKELNEKK